MEVQFHGMHSMVHCDTGVGATHMYADAVYAVYRFAFQLEMLGVTRPPVRRNRDVPAFREEVRLWDQPPRVWRTMLFQWMDGEFVPEVVDEAVPYLLRCTSLSDFIILPSVTIVGFPQERMPSLLSNHVFWIVHEGKDLFLVVVDVVQVKLVIWSTQSHPAITHWIRSVIDAMMPLDARIHTGWRHQLERRFPTIGVTS